MISQLIAGFVSILIGVSLVGPLSTQVLNATVINGALYNSGTWATTVLNLVPGFFALGILGVGVAVCYSIMYQAGII